MGTSPQARHSNALYEFGAFTLDPEERVLSRNGQPLPLAPRVFDTLLILVINAGSLVRKSELMDFVWPHARVEEVNLAHNISDLRRILGASAIQTVPKHGYRFVEQVRMVPRSASAPEFIADVPQPAAPIPPARRFRAIWLQASAACLILVGAAVIAWSGAAEARSARQRLTSNSQAQQLYFEGRYFLGRRDTQDFEKAAEIFQRSIRTDPQYAPAYAGLAEALAFASKPMDQIRAALNRALSLDPGLAEAHALLGLNAMNLESDWAKAEREFRRAIQLNPSLVEAHQWYGDFLGYMGRFQESAVQLDAAIAADPLSPILWSDKCEMFTLASRFPEAIATCRYVLDMHPDYFIAHYQLVQAYILNRQPREALEVAQAAVREDNRPTALARLAQAYAASGDRDRARALIEQLEARAEDPGARLELAGCYAVLGDRDKALEWLEKNRSMGAALMIGLKMNPLFASLHGEPRFRALLQSMHL